MISCHEDYEEDQTDIGVNIYIIIIKNENEKSIIYFIIKSPFLIINNLNKIFHNKKFIFNDK